ncbi:MAG: endonuclease/exonuclease/phosphatase family protein [Muribaculaceae bacterium]|nr:endonuclease/exonuclease/phosphatase family protein [Muribaculaceae bacterium]
MKKLFYGLLVIVAAACSQPHKPAEMNVATYNLRLSNGGDSLAGNGWGQRAPYVAKLIQYHDFDIFGTQEGKHHQLEDLKAMMPEYEYIGVGRDDGAQGGEYAAIFYKPGRFELLDSGNFWLSTDTTRPNKGWDAACIRVCTWGKFRDKETDNTFVYFNLHMDHVGVIARAESAKLILEKIKAFPEKLPVMLSGDFNVDQTNESYLQLQNSGILADAYTTAELVYANNGTFNAFATDGFTDERIDHIFLSPEFKVKKYGVLTDTYRAPAEEVSDTIETANFPKEVSLRKYTSRNPSDHFPVAIRVELDSTPQ